MKPFTWRGNTDFYSGLLLAAIAAFALVYVRTLDIGTVQKMRPGYFPLGLALILLGMGLVLIVKGALVCSSIGPVCTWLLFGSMAICPEQNRKPPLSTACE